MLTNLILLVSNRSQSPYIYKPFDVLGHSSKNWEAYHVTFFSLEEIKSK